MRCLPDSGHLIFYRRFPEARQAKAENAFGKGEPMGSERIKGITIEIGGDTQGLNQALKETNGSIKNTQTQLKDVERLLKLDPSNTVVLQQKQELLAKIIEDTGKKLETLKTASEQAARSADQYDSWKAKFTPIQQEIDQTKAKLKELEAAQREMKDGGQVESEQ